MRLLQRSTSVEPYKNSLNRRGRLGDLVLPGRIAEASCSLGGRGAQTPELHSEAGALVIQRVSRYLDQSVTAEIIGRVGTADS
jgi:hypothetical protein